MDPTKPTLIFTPKKLPNIQKPTLIFSPKPQRVGPPQRVDMRFLAKTNALNKAKLS